MSVYGLDLETDNDGQRAWIVQWCIFGEQVYQGTSRDALRERLRKLGRTKEKIFIYIHNLKYDLEFFKYCLWELKNLYDAKIDPIFRTGSPIQVNVEVNGRMLIFRDSLKKWQGNLRSLGDAIGCPKLENSDPDFLPGWSRYVDFDDPKTWEYIRRDAEICYRAGQWWHEEGMRAATTSGDAWKYARTIKSKDWWESRFTPLTLEQDRIFRRGYFGGINISREQGHYAGEITHEDKVSMYPGVMLDKPLPVGAPIDCGCTFPKGSELWVGELRVKLKLKVGHIAWFSFKDAVDWIAEKLSASDHVERCRHWHDLLLTSVDWKNLELDYDIEIDHSYAHFWTFAWEIGSFKDYIEFWAKKKKTAQKGTAEREHAKRMLNALYGRFALIPEKTTTTLEEEDGDLTWKNCEEDGEPTAYLPYAMFITAWARWELMSRVRKVVEVHGEDSVLHSDTDSVIYLGTPIGGYGSDIGQWALESQPDEIYEGGFKRYIEIFHNREGLRRFNVTCAGVPQQTDAQGCPKGMWLELLDKPDRILMQVELGSSHYKVKSEWLRKMLEEHGKDPDRVNTLKLLPRKVLGGVILEGHSHQLDDGMRLRFCRSL